MVVKDYGHRNSKVYIEPKASGQSVFQMLKKLGLNVREVKMLEGDKITRANSVEPFLWGGKVKVLKGGWNDSFIEPLMSFPRGKHDEPVDCLIMALNEAFNSGQRKIQARRIRLLG